MTAQEVQKLLAHFDKVRTQKIAKAEAEYTAHCTAAKKTFDYQTNFWGGDDGFAWFLKKNNLTIEDIQAALAV